MKKNRYPLFFLFFLISATLSAQVSKNIMVEHFTNTRCGICSSKNPSFYQNLDSQNNPNIFHISYHPSSPYSTCLFNQHNSTENDGRTNYYNNYGSTPKLVIQGVKIPTSTNFGSEQLFEDYENKMSPLSIQIDQQKSPTSIDVTLRITAEAEHNLGELSLFVGVAEDTIFYAAPNGEQEHYDVFRKAFTATEGMAYTPFTVVGTTDAIAFETTTHPDWKLERLFTFVILQDPTTKEVIQTQVISPSQLSTSSEDFKTLEGLSVFPNPTQNFTTIQLRSTEKSKVSIFNLLGELVLEKDFIQKIELDLSSFPKGAYFLDIENEEGRAIKKLIKE